MLHRRTYSATFAALPPLLVLLSGAWAAPLKAHPALRNPDFRPPLDSGWAKEVSNLAGWHRIKQLKDTGVTVSKTQCGYARLSQVVTLPNLDQQLSSRLKLHAEANKMGYHSYAALTAAYLDSTGRELGFTRYAVLAGDAWHKDTRTEHYVRLSPDAWTDVTLNLKDELGKHLSGVASGRVRALRITLDSFASGTSAC